MQLFPGKDRTVSLAKFGEVLRPAMTISIVREFPLK